MITFDAAANTGGLTSGATTYTWNHTVGIGSDRGLLISLHWFNGTTLTVSSITYNGVAMSLVASRADSVIDTVALYYLRAPATGTNTISVTFSAGPGFFIGGSASFFGLDQNTATSAVEATASAIGTTATSSVNLTTVSVGAYYFASCFDDPTGASGTITATDGQTETYNFTNAGGEDAEGYKGPFAPNTSHTPAWSLTSTGPQWVIVTASLKPAFHFLASMGAGS